MTWATAMERLGGVVGLGGVTMRPASSRQSAAAEPAGSARPGTSPGPEAELIPFQVDQDAVPAQSFESFYAGHRDSIAVALSFALNDRDLGFEAADEAMVRAYKRWGEVSGYSNREGWVFRVGLNWGRSWIRRRLTAVLKAPMIMVEETTSAAVEDLASDTDLAAAVASLSHSARAVVVLRYQLDYSVTQIADVLGIPEGTVKSRLSRATKRLEAELGSVGHGEKS